MNCGRIKATEERACAAHCGQLIRRGDTVVVDENDDWYCCAKCLKDSWGGRMTLPWNERLTMLTIHPEAATLEDIARMATELSCVDECSHEWIDATNENVMAKGERLHECTFAEAATRVASLGVASGVGEPHEDCVSLNDYERLEAVNADLLAALEEASIALDSIQAMAKTEIADRLATLDNLDDIAGQADEAFVKTEAAIEKAKGRRKMIEGWYYLHINGELIYKKELGGTAADIRESDFAVALWACDPTDRGTAWDCLVESLAAGAKKERVFELAEKWHCDDDDAQQYNELILGGRLFRDGSQWCATQGNFVNLQKSPAGFGDTALEALGDLCKNLGYKPSKTWGMHFSQMMQEVAGKVDA